MHQSSRGHCVAVEVPDPPLIPAEHPHRPLSPGEMCTGGIQQWPAVLVVWLCGKLPDISVKLLKVKRVLN